MSAKTSLLIDSCGLISAEKITCIGMREHGIVLSNNSFLCSINNCKVGATGESAIAVKNLFKGGRGGDWVPSQIANCVVFSCGKGIECEKSLVINISDCQVYQTFGPAFYIHSESNSVIITGCRTYQITGSSVVVQNSHEINISGNMISWSTEHGIILDNVKWGAVAGNNIIDNGSINIFNPDEDSLIIADYRRPFTKKISQNLEVENYNGVWMRNKTMGIAVTGNSIYNWHVVPPMKHGIEEDSTCVANNISANNINYCVKESILSKGKETLVSENKVYPEIPYYRLNSNKPFAPKNIKEYQVFDTRLIREFIDELNATDR
ncbi:MAG: right-handed parallel beta-helix repeat-containing protein [Draconibacterium sp.]